VERRHDVSAAVDARWITRRADQDEVVVHHLASVDPETALDKGKLCRSVVDEDDAQSPRSRILSACPL
jgi:hypothetical protein